MARRQIDDWMKKNEKMNPNVMNPLSLRQKVKSSRPEAIQNKRVVRFCCCSNQSSLENSRLILETARSSLRKTDKVA